MEKTNIAFFIDNLLENLDGVSITSHQIIARLPSNVNAIFFTPLPPKNKDFPYPIYHTPSLTFLYAKDYKLAIPGKKKHIFSILDEFAPDLIHWSSPSLQGKYATEYAKKKGIPNITIYHSHISSYVDYVNLIPFKQFVRKKLEQHFMKLYGKADVILAPTASMKKFLIDKGMQDKRVKVWGRGVDTDRFTPVKRDVNKFGKHNSSKFKVLFVSRLVHYKETDLLIRLNGMLNSSQLMVIVGEGPEEAKMKKQMPNALFMGKLTGEELANIYASADIFVFPSLTETFGNVVLEAMAAGLPVVAADAGGPADILRASRTGFVVEPKNTEAFLEKINLLTGDTGLKNSLSKEARSYAISQNWPSISQLLIKNYRELIKEYTQT